MPDAPGAAAADVDAAVAVDAHRGTLLARDGGGEALLLLLQRGVARVRAAGEHAFLEILHRNLPPPLPRASPARLFCLVDVAFRHRPRKENRSQTKEK